VNCEKSLAVSTDGGTTWTSVSSQPSGITGGGSVAVSATGGGKIVWSPAGVGVFYTTGGAEWDNTYGLWHSLDSGASFTKLANVEEAGVRGIFRSTDAGQTWVRINDDQHQWGRAGETAITGDPRIFGRVYIGTNGRGIIYGDGQ
jgi:photosystem II stability/assembly factor-like uncharacterized protein